MAVSALCSDARHEEVDEGHDITTPLPWCQLLIVLLIQFAEPITAFVIFPFINQMIRETGVTGGDETRTGYFAGIIVRPWFCNPVHYDFETTFSGIYVLHCRGHYSRILGHGVRPIRTSLCADIRSSWTVNNHAWFWCIHAILVSRHISILSGSIQRKHGSVPLPLLFYGYSHFTYFISCLKSCSRRGKCNGLGVVISV
jgi:hypothetical protein